MSFTVSDAALGRARDTIQASLVLRRQAPAIASACLDATPNEVVVAVVGSDLRFGGVWTVPAGDLRDCVRAEENAGWSLVFAPQTTLTSVEKRCEQWRGLAATRLTVMQRWRHRHG